VSLLSDIASLKTRVTTVERRTTAVEAKNAAQGSSRVALDGRSTNLEKEVDALKYIISPTPNAGSTSAPVYATVIDGQTINSLQLTNVHDRTYTNCTFTGRTTGWGTLSIQPGCYNLSFINCTVNGSTNTNENCVSVWDQPGGTVHDVYFDTCHILQGYRMGIEVNCRDDTASSVAGCTTIYQRVNIYNCTIDAQYREGISYDGPAFSANCVVYNTLIKGAGMDPAGPSTWLSSFEINGPSGFDVDRLTCYQGKEACLNLNGPPGSCDWNFTNCVFDARVKDAGQTVNNVGGSAMLCLYDVDGATFTDCASYCGPNYVNLYFAPASNCTFTRCTWQGDTEFKRGYGTNGTCTGNTGDLPPYSGAM
jgi:hypothetical protein